MKNIHVQHLHVPKVGSFDTTMSNVVFDIPWHWADQYFWWFFADHPSDLDWRFASENMQATINGVWTDVTFIGAERPEWFSMYRHGTGNGSMAGAWADIAIVDGMIAGKCWTMRNISRLDSSYAEMSVARQRIHQRTGMLQGRGRERMPDFTPEQIEELHVKLDGRYLIAAEMFIVNRIAHAKQTMEGVVERLAELGFEPPAHDFVREPLIVPIYRSKDLRAFWISSPEGAHNDLSNCECGECEHSHSAYMDSDSCCCRQCMDNNNHWHEHGGDKDHCNFCEEFHQHLIRSGNIKDPDAVEEVESEEE